MLIVGGDKYEINNDNKKIWPIATQAKARLVQIEIMINNTRIGIGTAIMTAELTWADIPLTDGLVDAIPTVSVSASKTV